MQVFFEGLALKNDFPVGIEFTKEFVGRQAAVEQQDPVLEVGDRIEIKIQRTHVIAEADRRPGAEEDADPALGIAGRPAPAVDGCSGHEHMAVIGHTAVISRGGCVCDMRGSIGRRLSSGTLDFRPRRRLCFLGSPRTRFCSPA
jgi:hypothetical protein